MKGIIGLDIDGTVTAEHASIPKQVIDYLEHLVADGWRLVFITGRPFCHCIQLFESLPFSCHVAPQNGALLIDFATREILRKRYLSMDILPQLEEICSQEETDFVLYLGPEFQDRVYYRRDRFHNSLFHLVQARVENSVEPWIATEHYSTEEIPSFASVKCFGTHEASRRISAAFESRLSLHAPWIEDPYDRHYGVIQGTHPSVNKGQALRDFVEAVGAEGLPVISAGDDRNDLPLLKAADFSIAMGSAIQEVKDVADYIAPAATEAGLVEGLKYAITSIGR